MGNRPPFETFKGPTCKGCYALGTACGHCEKCVWERDQISNPAAVENPYHWLTCSDLMASFAAGVIRSHRWPVGGQLIHGFEERLNLFARRMQGIWPPAISPTVGLVQVDPRHFRDFVKHFLKTECGDWGVPFDLDGTVLDVMQELRRNIATVEGDRVEAVKQ